MKRFLCVAMVLLMVVASLPCFALAESGDSGEDAFTLRNGIVFGDTMETILSKETTLTRTDEDSNVFTGTIAGYSNAACEFRFDDAGGLESMDYLFTDDGACTSKDAMNEIYKTLYQSLNRKYGTPLGNTGGSCELITGPAMNNMVTIVYLLGTVDGYSGDYVDYDEWIVDDGDDHVKIDLVSYYYRDDDYDYHYFVDASYLHYTDADYDAAVAEKQQERESVDDDM